MFPQLAGLGRSSTAAYYGLAGVEEAAEYLRDRVLGDRLVEASAGVRTHLAHTKTRRACLEELMGSHVDGLKLVSCMTLFQHVAKALYAADPQPRSAAMAEHAEKVLAAAAADGYERCAYTEEHLRRLST